MLTARRSASRTSARQRPISFSANRALCRASRMSIDSSTTSEVCGRCWAATSACTRCETAAGAALLEPEAVGPQRGRGRPARENRHLRAAPGQVRAEERADGPRADDGDRLHSITRSARTSSDGGTVRPRLAAVLRFTISSKRTGRSMGISAGRVPRRTFTITSPACRNIPGTLGP